MLRSWSSLGACAQVQPAMARDLFPAGFVSCWGELEGGMQEALVRSLEAALASPTIPPDIVTTLLNLAEFMEHDEKSLPLDTRTLGALAEKCHAFAKALHYKELEYHQTPGAAVEALISINNHLRQPEAAIGILTKAQQDLHMELKESWYEKLQRWEEALEAYERKYAASPLASPAHLEATLGRMRCAARHRHKTARKITSSAECPRSRIWRLCCGERYAHPGTMPLQKHARMCEDSALNNGEARAQVPGGAGGVGAAGAAVPRGVAPRGAARAARHGRARRARRLAPGRVVRCWTTPTNR